MNLKNISNLSDDQLVFLYRNPNTVSEIKKAVLKEINYRDIKSQMSLNNNKNVLNKDQKRILITFPFLFKYYRKLFFKQSWSKEKDKEFWKHITIGFAIYTLLFIIVFIIFNITHHFFTNG